MVKLNLASNVIRNAGLKTVFEELTYNNSLKELNVSTIVGKNRNRIGSTGISAMKDFLI